MEEVERFLALWLDVQGPQAAVRQCRQATFVFLSLGTLFQALGCFKCFKILFTSHFWIMRVISNHSRPTHRVSITAREQCLHYNQRSTAQVFMWNGSEPQLKPRCCARYSPPPSDMRYKHHSRSPVLFRTGCYRFTSYVLFSQRSSCVWESPWPYLHFRTTTPGSTMLSAPQLKKAKKQRY